MMVASRASVANSHSIFVSCICSPKAGKIHCGLGPGLVPSIPWAVVVTVTVAIEALDPFKVTALGDTVHVPACGAPLQVRLTA